MLKWLSKAIIKLIGWTWEGEFPHHLKKFIVIVAPHTSNWDFIVGLLFRKALGMERARYLGKHQLFKPPFGFIFRWLGGYPVNRTSSQNMVEEVVKIFNQHESFVLALSPEGTRSRVERLRTGFYNIALKAHVPVVMASLDYGNKRVVLSEPFMLTGNQEEDFDRILKFFRPVKGKHPELGLMHL